MLVLPCVGTLTNDAIHLPPGKGYVPRFDNSSADMPLTEETIPPYHIPGHGV